MSLLDWFKIRPSHFEADAAPDAELQKAIEKALTLTNPRLKLLRSCAERLTPAVRVSIEYLRERILALPPALTISEASWSSTPVLRAFFANASEVPAVLGRSHNLRTFFDRFPAVDEAFLVLGMRYTEQHSQGVSLQGDVLQRDISQRVVDFSSPGTRICGHSESEVRHLLGNQSFEYLLAQAMLEIGELRSERQDLEESRSLIQARLRMLQMQGPGLGSLFASAPEASGEQLTLESRLLENEQQLMALGHANGVLETELDYLCQVLASPERYLNFEATCLRLNTLNVVLDPSCSDRASNVEFTMALLDGVPKVKRAFIIAKIQRSELPPQRINWAEAERLL